MGVCLLCRWVPRLMLDVGLGMPVLFEIYHVALYEENNPDWAEFASSSGQRPRAKLEVNKAQEWIVAQWLQVYLLPTRYFAGEISLRGLLPHTRNCNTPGMRRGGFSSPQSSPQTLRSALLSTYRCVAFFFVSLCLDLATGRFSHPCTHRTCSTRRARRLAGWPMPSATIRPSSCD